MRISDWSSDVCSSDLDSTSVSSGSGAIICNIARAAFGAAESMSRTLRSKKQPEDRGRKRHAKLFGGGAAGHHGGRVQRARADANQRATAEGAECAVLDPGSKPRRLPHAGEGANRRSNHGRGG